MKLTKLFKIPELGTGRTRNFHHYVALKSTFLMLIAMVLKV